MKTNAQETSENNNQVSNTLCDICLSYLSRICCCKQQPNIEQYVEEIEVKYNNSELGDIYNIEAHFKNIDNTKEKTFASDNVSVEQEFFDKMYLEIMKNSNYKNIGGGHHGSVYKFNEDWVFKCFKKVRSWQIQNEEKMFNMYYGKNASRAYVSHEEDTGVMIMKYIPGEVMSVDNIPDNFNELFDKMNKKLVDKGIKHMDLIFREQTHVKNLTLINGYWYNLGNFLYDKERNEFHPIDFGIAEKL